MSDINQHLISLADRLDKEGSVQCANIIDELIENQSLVKVAQYVGAIGYVLKQNRAIANCIRKKRVADAGSMQDVVLQCLKEYQDGQNYQNNEWTEKYAQILEKRPDLFSEIHLNFLSEVGKENEIQEHITRIQKASSLLEENSIDDDVINRILYHAQVLGEVLKKEVKDNAPFKVAAPPQRSRWSRFWNPGEKDWWSPFSWGKDREVRRWRGEDIELDKEIDFLLSQFYNMKSILTRIQNEINNIRRLAVYKRGYPQDKNTQEIHDVIQKLNPKDKEEIIFDIGQLQRSIPYKELNLPYKKIMNRMVNFAKFLISTRQSLDKNLEDINSTLKSLGQRGQLLGRRPFRAPGQAEVISNTFDLLQRIAGKLNQNPLDEEGLRLGIRTIARLNDVLNPVAGSPSMTEEGQTNLGNLTEETVEWLKQETPMFEPSQPETETPTAQPVQPPQSSVDLNVEKIKTIIEEIKKSGDADEVARAFRVILQSGTVKGELWQLLHQILENLERQTNYTSSPISPTMPEQPKATYEENEDDEGEEDTPDGIKEYFKSSSVIDTFVKTANLIDTIDESFSNLMDTYLTKNKEKIISLKI